MCGIFINNTSSASLKPHTSCRNYKGNDASDKKGLFFQSVVSVSFQCVYF